MNTSNNFKTGDLIQRANPDGELVGLPFLANEIDTIFQDGRFVKANTSNIKQESLEEAAKRYAAINNPYESTALFSDKLNSFKSGAEWQKEKDKATILALKNAMESALKYIPEKFYGQGESYHNTEYGSIVQLLNQINEQSL